MQQVEHQVVKDFMIVGMEEDNADEVSFTVFGKPLIQKKTWDLFIYQQNYVIEWTRSRAPPASDGAQINQLAL